MKRFNILPYSGKLAVFAFHVLLMLLVLSAVFAVYYSWVHSMGESEKGAVQLAKMAEAGLPNHPLFDMTGDENDPAYYDLKNCLSGIVKSNHEVRFAYLYVLRDGKIYLLADSEPADSDKYSPPGQLFDEAAPIHFLPFENKETVMTQPAADPWGSVRSVLVPVINLETDEVTAVFGIDFASDSWYRRAFISSVFAGLVALSIITIYIGYSVILKKNKELRLEHNKLKETTSKLSVSETLFRSLFEQANIGIAIVRNLDLSQPLNENMVRVNPAIERILGRTRKELGNLYWGDIINTGSLPEDRIKIERSQVYGLPDYEGEQRIVRPDGTVVWVNILFSPFLLDQQEYHHICIIGDISRRKELEHILHESERSKTLLLDCLPGLMYRCNFDQEWTMQYISKGCLELTGYEPERLLMNRDLSFADLIAQEHKETVWSQWNQAIREHRKYDGEYQIITADGRLKWVWEQGKANYGEDGEVISLEGLILDISEQKDNELRLKHLSEHDGLTDLPNIRSFEKTHNANRLKKAMRGALTMVNVRRFSVIYGTYGYLEGQSIIQTIAGSLSILSNEHRILYHISMDRFVFYIEDYQSKQELIDFSLQITNALDGALYSRTISFNIGILMMDENNLCNAENAIRRVSIAAEHKDENERFAVRFFNENMEQRLRRENSIIRALTASSYDQNDQSLHVVYQPVVNAKTSKIAGFEALARFHHQELGDVSPLEFIKIAEASQLILPLGSRLLKIIFAFALRLMKEGNDSIFISLNISVIQLQSSSFLRDLQNLVAETGVNPHNLFIELTESVFADNFDEINKRLDSIRKMGFKIAIDDFGTGYSSLARVRDLHVDCLKIDKCFIDKLEEIDLKTAVSGDIISMAHKMGQCVVAEGVEHENQRRYLYEHDCDLMQGYLFSKPVHEEAAIELLHSDYTKDNLVS